LKKSKLTGINIDIFGAHSCRSALISSMKSVMVKASINIDIFGAHSCRSASISSMKSVMAKAGINIDISKNININTSFNHNKFH
jgi:hypothetical protein